MMVILGYIVYLFAACYVSTITFAGLFLLPHFDGKAYGVGRLFLVIVTVAFWYGAVKMCPFTITMTG